MAESTEKRPDGSITRTNTWNGVETGEPVRVNVPRELRLQWVFIAHGRNEATGEEWVEVRGGRPGESKRRAFRTELIYPVSSKRGSKLVGPSLEAAPRLSMHSPQPNQ